MAQEQKTHLTPEEEIRELERRLEEKKKAFAEQGEVREEKELFREALKEHIEELAPSAEERMPKPQPVTVPPSDAQKKKDLEDEKEREEQVRALIEIALTKGISEAVRVAGSMSPYLLDELHDHLADDFYEKLVALRQIEQL